MKQKSIVIIARGTESYGVLTKLSSLGETFVRRGWAVTAYSIGEGGFADRFRAIDGVNVVVAEGVPATFDAERYGKLTGYARVLRSSIGFAGRLRRFIKRSRFDVAVFCEHGLVLPIAAAVTGLQTRFFWLMPNIVSANYPLDINRLLYGAAFRASGMIPVGNSAYTLETLGKAGRSGGWINLGVDPDRFPGGLERPQDFPIKPEPSIVHLLIAARMHPEKGQLPLLEAILSERDLRPIHLVLCGGPLDTAYAASIRELANRHDAADRLHMLGPVAETAPYNAAADVVASVRTDPEPFGLSIIEAMHAGKPVLAHQLGGPADIVVDGETGWLLQDTTRESFVDGLRRILASRDHWTAMGQAAKARAARLYTVDAMTTQLEETIFRHLPHLR